MYKNIFLVRHGRSESNEDKTALQRTPDFQHHLVPAGIQQALQAGDTLNGMLKGLGVADFLISPYFRTLETYFLMKVRLHPVLINSEQEDHRLREREWEGSFKPMSFNLEMLKDSFKYNSFFARLPHGESGADVMERFKSLWHEKQYLHRNAVQNLVIVSHSFTNRVIEAKLTKLSVWEFPEMVGMKNGEVKKISLI